MVYARGFGYADLAAEKPVEPTSLFCIASVSKPITAIAVVQLIQRRKIRLDDKISDILQIEPVLGEGRTADPRLTQVTIRHLLSHTGGWDRKSSYDPMGLNNREKVRKLFGITRDEFHPLHVVRYMAGQPLDFDPGTNYAYSNFGYCLLGRVIEKVSGQAYEDYVRAEVLAPLGISNMRIRERQPVDNEVVYYRRHSVDGQKRRGEFVPREADIWPIKVFESHGGWLASAVDLVKLASAFDNPRTCKILSPQAIEAMFSRPAGPVGFDENGQPKREYYGFGWMVWLQDNGRIVGHGGSAGGMTAAFYRRYDGINWVCLTNTDNSEPSTVPTMSRVAEALRQSNLLYRYDLFRTAYPPTRKRPSRR